jgi:hypothetical protein
MDKSLQSAINSYYEIYSDNAEVLSESEVELGQSPTPGGMTPKKPATGSAGPVKKPGNAVPTRKPGQPITSLKDSYEIVLDYLINMQIVLILRKQLCSECQSSGCMRFLMRLK